MAKIIDLRGKTMGGHSKRSRITKIARHHSATSSGDVFAFQRHWKNLGWKTGGYHEIILRDGTVQLCYDSNVITNGVKNHNSTTYHICLVGNGNFTEAQERAFDERAKYNLKRLVLSVNDILGHCEFKGANTSCPGVNMNAVRARLKGNKSYTPPKKQTASTTVKKSISQMASEVIAGKHGSGHANRQKSLGISKAEYEKVRAEVNNRAGSTSKPASKKSITQMVNEVLAGKHGNGHAARQKSLGISNAEYNKVKMGVNRRLMGAKPTYKSISQMATEVIQGKHGTGHENRRKSLGISRAEYEKVRKEVNRRL